MFMPDIYAPFLNLKYRFAIILSAHIRQVKRMAKRNWLIATLFEGAPRIAQEYGFGLEIDEFCTASNMDTDFEHWNSIVLDHMKFAQAAVFHAPFAELSPCAIDPVMRKAAMKRFFQAAALARSYGIRRMVVHGGFIPNVYFPIWYEEKSAEFWREFLSVQPDDFELLIENVMEDDPASMQRMFDAIGDKRAGICLDTGHAHVVSRIPVEEWITTLSGRIRHVHLHNNYGEHDTHNPPGEGTIDMERVMALLDAHAPEASITFECLKFDSSLISVCNNSK